MESKPLGNAKDTAPRLAAAHDLLGWLRNRKMKYRSRFSFKRTEHYAAYRSLASEIIRHYRKYEFFVKKLTSRKPAKLDHEVVVCLMLGISQLEKDVKAEYAAVNETVNLIAALGKPLLKGFVNANLRAFIRNKKELLEKFEKQKLAVRTSHSDLMVQRWRQCYGKKTAGAICEANNILPQIRIVINPNFDEAAVLTELTSLKYEVAACGPSGYIVGNPSGLFETEPAKSGVFLVQDASYQFVNDLIKDLPKKRTLDACAAPGGKLFSLEWAFGSEIEELIASDISGGRIKRMVLNGKNFKSKAAIVRMDASKSALKRKFDLILADVPCSSTGVIRKYPEIKWDRRPSDFKRNRKLQLSILEGLKDSLTPRGYLLYSTCSLEREENQETIETFLKLNGSDFRLVPMNSLTNQESLTSEGYYQCLPQSSVMGSFGALIQKK